MLFRIKLLLLCMATLPAMAQKKISLTPEPITVSDLYHFRDITITDSRLDTTILGRVVKGISGVNETLSPLKLKEPAIPSLQAFYAACTDHLVKGQQDIHINITDIFLDEDPETGSVGTVDIRIEVYAIKEGLYYPIHTFDRVETIVAFDATKKMICDLNTSLKNVLEYANNFYKPEVLAQKGLTMAEVLKARDIEKKSKYAVYATDKPQDGIYGSFREMLDNKPGRPINMLDELIAKNMEKPKRKREVLYGYCKDGMLYAFGGKKYDTSHIYRRGDDFYMQNYGVDPEKQGDQNALLWFSGLALLMNTDSWYEFVLNPRAGTWYQMTKLGTKKRKEEEAVATDAAQSDSE
jgi:hypothetical protein